MNIQNKLSIWARLRAPRPAIFKTISEIAVVAGALAFAISNFNAEIVSAGIVLPAILIKISAVAQWVAAGALAIAQLTVDFEKYQKQNSL
jgi:hypothetical protein